MNDRLKKALDFSNFRMILSTRKKNLKKLLENKSLFHYNSGIFKATPEFLSFVDTIRKTEESFVFIDYNENPIIIENLDEFYQDALDRYKTSLNQYYESYQKLTEARDIQTVLDWEYE